MFLAMVVVFVLGYTAIALEHPIKVDKAASALVTSVILWVLFMIGSHEILSGPGKHFFQEFLAKNPDLSHLSEHKQYLKFIVDHEIVHHLGEISEILFFLWGAMTIVETVDSHNGFKIITDKIKTTNKVKLLWIISFLTFFMSAALDNLTTTIVMVTLLNKLIREKKDRWFFASMIVIAANAGGAWSPIGDVTTIMLWIGGQITAWGIIRGIFLVSLVNMLIPLIIVSFFEKGNFELPKEKEENHDIVSSRFERNLLFFLGIGALLSVPVFKTVTHLPPYMGMLLGLSVLWIITDLMHRNDNPTKQRQFMITAVLRKIDAPTIFFFLGILSAVAALQSAGHLHLLSLYLDNKLHNIYFIDMAIGLLSAVVDNVPLTAGGMGMYPIPEPYMLQMITDPAQLEWAKNFVQDGLFWEFLAYTAGTGGSILIIGSAAGVAAMGLEKIDFIWYLKRMSLLALSGFLGGSLVYYLIK